MMLQDLYHHVYLVAWFNTLTLAVIVIAGLTLLAVIAVVSLIIVVANQDRPLDYTGYGD
jgi:hypothetical protein